MVQLQSIQNIIQNVTGKNTTFSSSNDFKKLLSESTILSFKGKVNNNGDSFEYSGSNIPDDNEDDYIIDPEVTAPVNNTHQFFEYKNFLGEKLKSNIDELKLRSELAKDNSIYNKTKAFKRITSLSRYLKEDMIGFVTPDGEHWFQGAMKYIIKGAIGVDMPDDKMLEVGTKYAKEFYGLLAKADSYWKSEQFMDYLMNHTNPEDPGVIVTRQAIKELVMEDKARNSQISFGYYSKLRYIKELTNSGGAYSGRPMHITDTPNDPDYPTLEHILPHSTSGDQLNIDTNFILVRAKQNSDRGNIPLLAFLKGYDAYSYVEDFPGWKEDLCKSLGLQINQKKTKKITLEQRYKLSKIEAKKVAKIVDRYLDEKIDIKYIEKLPENIKKAVIVEIEKFEA